MNFIARVRFLVIALFIINIQPLAQDNNHIVISVSLTRGLNYLSSSTVFSDFEATHPGVRINVIYKTLDYETVLFPEPAVDLPAHLASVDTYSLEADVFMMSVGESFFELSLEATRAGYILDLYPLFNADDRVHSSDYYPTAWQAAQWDGGLWLLPTSTSILAMVYEADAFDAAGLNYPNENWTATEFVHAAEVLALRDTTGNVLEPSFIGMNGSDAALIYGLLELPLYDANEFPYLPAFVREETLGLANHLLPALESGAMFNYYHDYEEAINLSGVVFGVDRLSIAYLNDKQIALLPGGSALVNINGLAVSGRTEHPQLAYELASYLAADRRVADAMSNSWGGTTLARPEYPDVVNGTNSPIRMDSPSDDAILIIDEALQNGIPASELLYYSYFQNALFRAASEGLDIETALRDVENLALSNLEIANLRRSEITGSIPTPIPEISLAEGEIELTFSYQEGDASLWQNFVDEFVADDPEVVHVIIQDPSTYVDYRQEGTDCFYMNASASQVGGDYFLDMTPLIAVDESLDPDNWLTGIFNSAQQDNSIYALPIDIHPLALWYDPNMMDTAGLQIPQNSSDLLDVLNFFGSEGNTVIASYQLSTSLLMLMAAEGAIPINYQTQPIQIDFTSEANLAGIQRILDLARSEIIKYGSIVEFSNESFPELEPFLLDYVADNMFRNPAYIPISFPVGNQYTPISYQTMAGFISHFSQYPEACYRLLRHLSHRPDLINGLPVQGAEALSSDYTNFYDSFNQQLNAPNVIRISSLDSEFDYLATYWLFQAFDSYVLEGVDLLAELRTAEQLTDDYLLCTNAGTLPIDCARIVDPTFSTLDS